MDDFNYTFGKESLQFLQMLNSQHTAIKFISEKKTKSNSLTFLTVQVQLIDDNCVWRKPLLPDFEANRL